MIFKEMSVPMIRALKTCKVSLVLLAWTSPLFAEQSFVGRSILVSNSSKAHVLLFGLFNRTTKQFASNLSSPETNASTLLPVETILDVFVNSQKVGQAKVISTDCSIAPNPCWTVQALRGTTMPENAIVAETGVFTNGPLAKAEPLSADAGARIRGLAIASLQKKWPKISKSWFWAWSPYKIVLNEGEEPFILALAAWKEDSDDDEGDAKHRYETIYLFQERNGRYESVSEQHLPEFVGFSMDYLLFLDLEGDARNEIILSGGRGEGCGATVLKHEDRKIAPHFYGHPYSCF
jgi:hypothetical protein